MPVAHAAERSAEGRDVEQRRDPDDEHPGRRRALHRQRPEEHAEFPAPDVDRGEPQGVGSAEDEQDRVVPPDVQAGGRAHRGLDPQVGVGVEVDVHAAAGAAGELAGHVAQEPQGVRQDAGPDRRRSAEHEDAIGVRAGHVRLRRIERGRDVRELGAALAKAQPHEGAKEGGEVIPHGVPIRSRELVTRERRRSRSRRGPGLQVRSTARSGSASTRGWVSPAPGRVAA
ncbi:hypothetical protein GCM10025867_25170 [Frondihabitans sucicola]|uniref:Uncharacterized protein n=1 Tax=Frondihabitans sucicola TaxID=1268041 RepID=A0ABM8GP92_9MICO|nr:hypothetical protein [Frondihabitans sucicola]BDZ50276.1 hypothetical protein GCM10025867_25170 [Frondihabitans sucicola]